MQAAALLTDLLAVIQSDPCAHDMRIRRQLAAYYYVVVVEFIVRLVRHCCLPILVMPDINDYEPGEMRL